jgi:anti-sigma factor RsiW
VNREPTMPDEDVLSAYLDGECTDAERAWVEGELASSPDLRAVLAEVAAARDAVRALPSRDAPAEFWARLLTSDADLQADAEAGPGREPVAVAVASAPIDLAERRDRRGRGRWFAAVAGAAAAAMIAAVVLVPRPTTATPPVGSLAAAHSVRSSLQDDAVSTLAPLAVAAGFRR